MSGLFGGGGGGSQANTPKQLNAIQTMQSSYGNCLPLVYGRTRTPSTIIWYTNFTATANTDNGGGGKGGGGVSASTSYTYSASVILALGEGPINGVNNTFSDKDIHGPGYTGGPNPWPGTGDALNDFGFGFFSGTVGQVAWTYPSGTPSAQKLNYSSTAYLTCSNFQLGSSAAMPNMTFEIDGLLGSLSTPYRTTAGDIDPASITYDYCSDPTHGCGFGPYYSLSRNNGVAAIVYVTVANGQGTTIGSPCSISTRTGFSVTSYTGSGTVGTLVFSGATNTPAGQVVTLSGFTPAALNGTYLVQTSTGSGATLTFNYPGGWPGNATGLGVLDVVVTPQTMPVGTVITNSTVFPAGATITSWNTFNNTFTVGTAASAAGSNSACTYTPSTWQSYCLAYGFFSSPAESTQRSAQEFLTEMLTLTNSDSIWSNGQQTIVALNDSAVSGNGYVHTPNNGTGGAFSTPIYSFTDDDYIAQEGDSGASDPVIVIRKGVSDTYNKVNVEFLDRSNQYNTSIAQAFDANDIAVNGERVMQTVSLHQICDNTVARLVAQLILQRQLYYKNSYKFQVRPDYCLLEPMDVIGITDSGLGITNALCRIDAIEEEDDGTLTIECTELPFGPGVTPQYNYQAGTRGWYLANVAPGVVRTPLFIPVPKQLQNGGSGYELWIAVNGVNTSTSWGGCRVWMSYDNSNFYDMGTMTGGSRYGTLAATYAAGPAGGVDTTNFLEVILNESTQSLAAGSQADADNARTLLWVDGELVAYEQCTLVTAGTYGMSSTGASGGTKYVQRALYGSVTGTHAPGANWARLDGAVFTLPLGSGVEGQTIYFKFQSFNSYGKALNALSTETTYSYVVASNYAGLGNTGNNWTTIGTVNNAGMSLYKPSTGNGAWDSLAYSQTGYSGGAAIAWQQVGATGLFMCGLSSSPTFVGSPNIYECIDYAIYNYNGAIYIYEIVGTTRTVQQYSTSSSQSFGTGASGDTYAVQYDGKFVKYFHNGSCIRCVQPPTQNLKLYGAFAPYTAGVTAINVSFEALSQTEGLVSNFLSSAPWKTGTSGAQGNYSDYQSSAVASSITLSGISGAPLGPHGATDTLWQINGCGTGHTSWNGGFYNGVGNFPNTDVVGLDPKKSYRCSVWFQYTGSPTTGDIYLGGDDSGNTMLDLGTGTPDTNPYYTIGVLSSLTAGKWYLLVGLLHGSGYTGAYSGVSGIYDPSTGLKVAALSALEFMQKSASGGGAGDYWASTMRVGIYGCTTNGVLGWLCRPRFEEVNGTEPSINQLLNSAWTGNIGNNAVTSVITATGTGTYVTYSSSGSYIGKCVVTDSITVGPFAYDAQVVVTVTANMDFYSPISTGSATAYCGPYQSSSALGSPPASSAVAPGYECARITPTQQETIGAVAYELSVLLPANTTTYFNLCAYNTLQGGGGGVGTICDLYNYTIKAEVIKK